MVKVYRILPNELGKINYVNNFMKKKHPIIGAHYMPGCGHCDDMIPKWNSACKKMKDNYTGKVIIALIHKDTLTDLPRNNIMGYPHIMSYVNDSEHGYEGDRSVDDLFNFMKLHSGSSLKKIQGGGKKTKRKGKKSRSANKSKKSKKSKKTKKSKKH